LFFLLSLPSFAGEKLESLKQLFADNFNSIYESNRCGENILRLVKLAKSKGIDLSEARIIRITNVGGSDFDSVPVMRAREKGAIIKEIYEQYYNIGPYGHRQIKPVPNHIRIRNEGPGRWVFFHAVLEFEDHIFDFDFTNHPRVLPSREYVQEMFFPKSRDFYLKNRSEFGLSFSGDGFDTFLIRIQEELIFSLINPNGPNHEQAEKMTLGEFKGSR
jgi:hypothetical protein